MIHSILMEPGVTISEVSRKTGVSKSHVSKIKHDPLATKEAA